MVGEVRSSVCSNGNKSEAATNAWEIRVPAFKRNRARDLLATRLRHGR